MSKLGTERFISAAREGVFARPAAMRGGAQSSGGLNHPPDDENAWEMEQGDASRDVTKIVLQPAPTTRIWKRPAGAERPTAELLAIFTDKEIELVTIRDPYALASGRARWAQIEFLSALTRNCRRLGAVTIEYAPDSDSWDDESLQRRNVGVLFVRAFPQGGPRLSLKRRQRRSPNTDDDFHDRSIELDIRPDGGVVKRHEIMIGRGIEALFDAKKQCTVIYTPPFEER